MLTRFGVLVFAGLMLGCGDPSATPEAAAAPGTDPLQGAWQLLETTAASSGDVLGNRPALRLFVDGRFSLVRELGTAPRPAVIIDSTATAAEIRAAWGPFEAQSGTYEIVGDTLITRPVVEKRPDLMAPGTFRRSTYRMAGDTLWVTFVANQNGPIPSPIIDEFLRVR
jgi:hypothetical protein